jgi:hypothetical protein
LYFQRIHCPECSCENQQLREVKALVLEGKDAVTERRIRPAETASAMEITFEVIAKEWLTMKQPEWSSVHYTKLARALERDIYPALGRLPIACITTAMVANAILGINKRDVLKTATRILQHVNGVFRYAQA